MIIGKPTPQQVTITLNIIAVALEPFFNSDGNDEAKDAVDVTLNYLMQVTR